MRNFYNDIIKKELRGQVKPADMADIYLAYIFLKFKRPRNDIKELFDYANNLTQLISEESQKRIKEGINQIKFDRLEELIDIYYEEKKNLDIYNETGDTSLYKLVIKLLNLETHDRIYDMGCGTGQFLYEVCCASNSVNSQLVIEGIDINPSNIYIAKMILELVYVQNKVQQGDGLYYDLKPFNKAFVFPPLGMKYKDDTYLKFNTKNRPYINVRTSTEWFFVDRIVSNLPEHGRAVALLPQRCLYYDGDQQYRKFLLENKLIEGIIQLPQGTITNTVMSPCLVIFSHNNDNIKVFDATKYVSNMDKNVKLEIDTIYLRYRRCDSDNLISINEIKDTYDLSVDKLLRKPIEIKYSKPIKEIGDIFQGSQYTISNFKELISDVKTNTRLLTSSDIEDGIIQWNSLTSINNPDKKIFKFALKKDDIVLTAKSSKMKIAIVDCDLEYNVILTGGMLCVRPNTELIRPEYLKMFLDSKKGKEIIKSIQKGSVIPTITTSAFSSINVSCPPLEKQLEVTAKYQAKLTMYAALKKELDKLEEQISSYYDSIEGDL